MIRKLSQVWPIVERTARERGAIRVGASDLADENVQIFEDWIDAGHHATMQYLAKNQIVRRDPAARFPWAKSVIVLLVPYAAERPDARAGSLSSHLARYALGNLPNKVLAAEYRTVLPDEKLIAADLQKTRRMLERRGIAERGTARKSRTKSK